MERGVNVNGEISDTEEDLPANDLPYDTPPSEPGKHDLGPCLYLGPSGERCYKRAVEGEFCLRHHPGASAPVTNASKAVAATAAIIAILWPYLADLLHEIVRLIHSQ